MMKRCKKGGSERKDKWNGTIKIKQKEGYKSGRDEQLNNIAEVMENADTT